MRKNEAKKTEELKKRITYEQQKITEEEQKREVIRLEAKKEFERLDTERAKQKEEAEARQFQREIELSKMKIEEKSRLRKEEELEVRQPRSIKNSYSNFLDLFKMAPFRLEQSLKQHNATKDDRLKEQLEVQKLQNEAAIEKTKVRMEAMSNFFVGEQGTFVVQLYDFAKSFSSLYFNTSRQAKDVELGRFGSRISSRFVPFQDSTTASRTRA